MKLLKEFNLLAILIGVGTLTACSSDPASPTSPFVGTWVATTVGGQSLPATLTSPGGSMWRVTVRTLTLLADDPDPFASDATWVDSTMVLTPSPVPLNCNDHFARWRQVDATTINVTVSCGFITRTFKLRSDGMLEAAVSFSEEGLTVFRRQ